MPTLATFNMKMDRQLWLPCGLLMLASLCACSVFPVSPAPSGPFIVPTTEESAEIAQLTHELDSLASACGAPSACDRLQFIRALLTLFESREAAKDFFRMINASSPLGTYSTLWVQLLSNEEAQWTNEQQHAFAHLAREWANRQLAEYRQEGKQIELPSPEVRPDQSCVVDALQKQVRERDRSIAKLRSQLDALKLIDLDTADRKRKIKLPASIVPTIEQRH